MRRGLSGIVAVAMLAASAAAVRGQDGEYTAPGELGVDPGEPSEKLAEAVEESVWTLGRVRIDPWIGLREVAWVKPPDQDGDLTVSAGAGVRLYAPLGSRLTFSAQVLPTYIWWKDRDEDRRLGGSYGVGLFYFAGRARVRATATTNDFDELVTDEVDRRAEVDSRDYRLHVDLPLGSRLGTFVSASRGDRSVRDPFAGGTDLGDLSYQTDRLEGGLTWLVGSRLTLRLGAGTTETTFDEEARDRSNDGDHWLAGLDWRRAKTSAGVTVRREERSGGAGSEFGEFDGTTWQGRLSWTPRSRVGLSIYGGRALSYSVLGDQAYFVHERLGLRVDFPVGRRVGGSAYFESGTRSYDADDREDDVTSWGGQLSMPLGRRLRLAVSGRSTRTEEPTGERSYSEYRVGLSFGSDRRGFF
jgi:hypothetical protein